MGLSRTTNIPPGRIPTLDGWRAIAILLVTVNHAAESIWGDRPDILAFTRLGFLGVDVFFALSGLLITKLLIEEQERTGNISLKAFYIRRCFRVLLPCYFYIAVISCFSMVHSRTELLASIFFFRNYLDAHYSGFYTAHLWSLAVEEHFYLLWPVIVVFASAKYGRQVAMWGAVAIGLWRIASPVYFPNLFAAAFPLYRTDYRLDSLLWGCVIGFLLHKSDALKRITPSLWIGILAVYLVCVRFFSPIHRLWMPMLLPLLIAGTVMHPDWKFSRILDCQPLKWIGKISYSLYLWQMIFLVQSTHSPFWWQRFPANLMLAFVVATICYYRVDLPLQRLGYRLAKRAEARHRDVSSADIGPAELVNQGVL